MHDKSLSTRGLVGTLHIVILSVIMAALVGVYYLIYSLFSLVLSPLHSVFGATAIYFILFIVALYYRYKYGRLVTDDDIKRSPFYQEPLPEIPDIDEDTTSGNVISTDDPVDEEQEETGIDIDEDEIPKELYIKVVQEDGYTMEDAKRDTLERRESDE